MRNIKFYSGLVTMVMSVVFAADVAVGKEALPRFSAKLGAVSARSEGDELVVSTGKVERRWKWTGEGLVTVGLKDLKVNREWVDLNPEKTSDWELPKPVRDKSGTIISLVAERSTDDGFTTEHLAITAEIAYPASAIIMQYVIWAYPDASGLRTQLHLKSGMPSAKQTVSVGKAGIQVVKGSPYTPPKNKATNEILPRSFISMLARNVELNLTGLDADKEYSLGLSWLDWDNRNRRQSVILSSVDGETKVTVVDKARMPASLVGRTENPEPRIVAIPEGLKLDGTIRMVVKSTGAAACISEVWLYESGAEQGLATGVPADRADELREKAPEGAKLVAYLNCGGNIAAPKTESKTPPPRIDYLPVQGKGLRRLAIGYYNDTQNRHKAKDHMIREEVVDDAVVDWANILCLEDNRSGIAMVKESHKCVNQPGLETGDFRIDEDELANTGMKLRSADLVEDRYRSCWASWLVVYGAGDSARELAIKQFDRVRFPIVLSRDMYIKADTWGSGNGGRESRNMGMEVEVLKEIDSVADLGIDGLQIDDGWQQSATSKGVRPDGGVGWRPHPKTYPEGWKNVKAKAETKGVRLALWAPAQAISLEEMKWNYDQVGFWTWKLDFANMGTIDRIETNIQKARDFILYTDHKAQMAWDVTERSTRYGYFWAREYGCIWLSNRKPNIPASVIPHPWLMLRENWELAKYVNINEFQLPIQNFQRVNREVSDACLYGHPYEVALGLMGVPIFFQTTYYYEGQARDEIRELLTQYKKHREAMSTSYVFPIGDEPTNASWAGFQWYHPDRTSGYLMIFRELHNQETEKTIALRFLANSTIKLFDIRANREKTITLDSEGRGLFTIEHPADFLFCKYTVL